MATRVAFSKEDQSHVVDWLVKFHPQKENRRGNVVWKQLTRDKTAHPWNSRHSWQSWRENYIDNMVHYDILISKKYRAIHGDNADPNNATTTTSAPPPSNSFPPKRPTNKPLQSKQNGTKPSAPDPTARPVHLAVPSSTPHRPLSPQSNSNSPSRTQVTRDMKSLAQYFANNCIEEDIRARANIFQSLKRSEKTSTWSRSRSALEWRDFYTKHKEEIDSLVWEGGLGFPPVPVNGNAAPNMKKRRREEEGQGSPALEGDNMVESTHRVPSQGGTNGVKKRRLNGTDVPFSHPEPSDVVRPLTPLTDGQGPPPPPPDTTASTTTASSKRTPVVLVPETPSRSHSSRDVTLIRLGLSKADLTGTSALVLQTVASALKNIYSSGMGPYGIKGSPIGSTTSDSPSPEQQHPLEEPSARGVESSSKLSMTNGVLRVNGRVPAMHIFPHSLPSLAPGLRETTTSGDAVLAPGHGDAGDGIQADETTPDAGVAQRKSTAYPNLKGGSIFTQVGQETPRGDVSGNNSRQEIFPHTLPHLTPTLRPGPNGENEYILNDDGVVFTSQRDNEDHEGLVFSKSLAHLSPELQIGQHEETIQDGSMQQHLETHKGNSGRVTPLASQSVLADDDDDEFEGPSPMPYLGSDRHSSRSYSFSHGQDDSLPGPLLEGLAKALSNQLLRDDGTDSQEVDELANDVDEEGEGGEGEGAVNERSGPRYIVPTKRPRRPSESPLFASSSASASDDEGRGSEGKPANVGVHYPVKAKVKAKGVVRVRGRRSSDRAMEVDDDDSESDGHEAMSDSDKENAAVADFNDMFMHESSPPAIGDDPVAPKSVAHVALQDEMDQTPDFHSSPKSLHFSGKTPTSPNVTATTIKPQALNIAPPATALASSKDAAAATRKQHGKGFPAVDADDRSRETLLKAALSYPSPNIPSELEEALQRKEEPSPLQRLVAEKAMFGKGAKDDGHVSDAAAAAGRGARHGKVRFDGVALDRDRRKTTGGIAFEFGGGGGGGSRGIVSDAVAGPSHSRFKAAPALFGSQRRSTGSQDIRLERKSVEVIELGDEEEEDESPLARYSAASRVATSPNKAQQGHAKSEQTMRSSSLGPTSTRHLPPPKPIPVPVVAASGSSLAGSSPLARSVGRKEDLGSVSAREFGTAIWSPIRFGAAAAETLLPSSSPQHHSNPGPGPGISPSSSHGAAVRPGFVLDPEQGLSIGFRDQEVDAEWVATVRGSPSITSKRIDPKRRSAPIPSEGDVVVYASHSRSPSRGRSRSRAGADGGGGRDTSGVDSLSIISEADKQRILTWLAENPNPNRSPGDVDSDGDSDDEEAAAAAKIFEGLALMFESMAANNGFAASVPRNVWKQCQDLSETALVVQAMTDAANATGLEVLEARQRRMVQRGLDAREAVLVREVDGRRSGRYSAGVGGGVGVAPASPSSLPSPGNGASFSRDSDGGGYESKGRSSRSKSRDGRRDRPQPPSFVPAEVVEPMLRDG